MSCSHCSSGANVTANTCCPPCAECQEADVANETLQSSLDNFIYYFFGQLTKTVVNGEVEWILPCNLASGLPGNPRAPDEGLGCYFLRLFADGIYGLQGLQGLQGIPGVPGVSAYTVVAIQFASPNVGDGFSFDVLDGSILSPGMMLYVARLGWVQITAQAGNQLFVVFDEESMSGKDVTIPAGAAVTIAGPRGSGTQGVQGIQGVPGGTGPAGAGGAAGANGQPAYTVTSGGFNVPAVGANVGPINVGSSVWAAVGEHVFVTGAGWYSVQAKGPGTITLRNLYTPPDNAAVGTAIPAGVTISPSGPRGATGPDTNVRTLNAAAGDFVVPALGATATVELDVASPLYTGVDVRIETAGIFQVTNIAGNVITIRNIYLPPVNAVAGVAIARDKKVHVVTNPSANRCARTIAISDGAENNDELLFADATAGAIVVTLPSAVTVGAGKLYTVKKIDAGAFTVTITPAIAETIDADPNVVIVDPWASVTIVSDGSNWFII